MKDTLAVEPTPLNPQGPLAEACSQKDIPFEGTGKEVFRSYGYETKTSSMPWGSAQSSPRRQSRGYLVIDTLDSAFVSSGTPEYRNCGTLKGRR
jgi:hypothetical protein